MYVIQIKINMKRPAPEYSSAQKAYARSPKTNLQVCEILELRPEIFSPYFPPNHELNQPFVSAAFSVTALSNLLAAALTSLPAA